MFAACLAHGEQTNHCKMTMVWWENNVSFLLCHCRYLEPGHVTSCVIVLKAVVSAVCVSLTAGERDLGSSGVEEDEGKRMELRRKESPGSDTD